MSRRRIKIDDEEDRWRYRCPAGHSDFEPTNDHFWCRSCARSNDDDHDPVFEELRDAKTGDLLEREDVTLAGYEDHLRHVGSD
jgi:hypothetical protein